MKLLIVEDEVKTADYLRDGLAEQGWAVDVARDGVSGLHLARELDYDVIVLDVMLPGMDGFAVLRELRTRKQTPVIMLTARDRIDDRVHGLGAGVDIAFGIEVVVEMAAADPPRQQFHTAQFDQAVAAGGFQAGGFGIEHDLAHQASWVWRSAARRAARSTRSLSGWPAWPRVQNHST